MKKSVVLCETQPVTAEGLRALLAASPDFELTPVPRALPASLELARCIAADIIVLDKAFGLQSVTEAVAQLRSLAPLTAAVVWGVSVTEPEMLQCIQAGARGILRKSASPETILACLRAVAEGSTWIEQQLAASRLPPRRNSRAELTVRERQVMELVGQGLKNREVAMQLGIRPGTVKVHLKHIFEKTGTQGRYQLALAGLISPHPRPAAAAAASA